MKMVPLGYLRKRLHVGFDLRSGEGAALAAGTRETDSRVSALCVLAVSSDRVPPTARLQKLLYDYCFAMDPGPFLEFCDERLDRRDRSRQERVWIALSLRRPEFKYWVDLVRDHYLLLAEVPLRSDGSTVVKFSLREEFDSTESRSLLRAGAPEMDVRFDIADFGWAGSDHIRLHAPVGARLSDALFLPATSSEPVTYTLAGSNEYVAAYRAGGRGLRGTLHVSLWPDIDRSIRWVLFLPTFVLALLVGGAGAEYLTQWFACRSAPDIGLLTALPATDCQARGFLWGLGGAADAAVGLSFLLSIAMLAMVYGTSGQPVHSSLLAPWRRLALGVLGWSWLGSVLLLVDRDLLAAHFYWTSWALLGTAAGLQCLLVWRGYWAMAGLQNYLANGVGAEFSIRRL
jgi:hypothetical protein